MLQVRSMSFVRYYSRSGTRRFATVRKERGANAPRSIVIVRT
jgi:hypothetical protein